MPRRLAIRAAEAALLLSGALLAGCAHTAAPPHPSFDADAAVERLALCTTTEAEARALFGTPTRVGRLRNERVLSWIVGEGQGGTIRYLAVLLDARGTVVDLYWNLPTEIPWAPANQCPGR